MYRFSSRSLNGAQVVKGFRSSFSLVAFLGLFCVRNVQAEEAQLSFAQLVSSVQPGTFAIPCVADWNGDGKKDLLVGYQTASKIAVYLNAGTDENPVFSLCYNLQAGGTDINLSCLYCGAPAPFVCDYDNDGKRDLLVGHGSTGCVYFYHNTNTDASPVLAAGVQLQAGGINLTVTSRATPYVYDWNGDGLNDLLCGCGTGEVYYFMNTGTAQAPTNAAGTRIQAGGVNLDMGDRSVVRMFDWDGDGKKDLIGSSHAGVYWCKNVGTPSAPLLLAMQAIQAPVATGGLDPILIVGSPSTRMRLDLVDWNNDGVMDLLVGDTSGKVSYFRGYRFMTSIIGQDMCGGYILQWNSASYLKYNVWAGHTLVGMTNCVGTNLPSGGLTTCWTNACGETQQFYRLQIAE